MKCLSFSPYFILLLSYFTGLDLSVMLLLSYSAMILLKCKYKTRQRHSDVLSTTKHLDGVWWYLKYILFLKFSLYWRLKRIFLQPQCPFHLPSQRHRHHLLETANSILLLLELNFILITFCFKTYNKWETLKVNPKDPFPNFCY